MRASIRQVAERAKVSPMTVTNVLRHRSDQVSEATRKRVLAAVEELNYVPVRSAVQNRHVATNCIGVLFLHDREGVVGLPTFRGMCERAHQRDYDLTVLLRPEPQWRKDGAEARFLDRRCDGYVFVGEERAELSEALVRHQIPVAECYNVGPHSGVATVGIDNVLAMQLAVQHLVEQGHRRIAHIAGPADHAEARARKEGFQTTMRALLPDAPDDLIVQSPSWGDLWGYEQYDDPGDITRPLCEAVLAMEPTAVVSSNDTMALALWKMAEMKGLRVPEDLSITGMDNINEAGMRGLTSVVIPFEEVGWQVVDAVLALIQGEAAEAVSRSLPVHLVERRSVAPPRP